MEIKIELIDIGLIFSYEDREVLVAGDPNEILDSLSNTSDAVRMLKMGNKIVLNKKLTKELLTKYPDLCGRK